jgi:hypothetical protein
MIGTLASTVRVRPRLLAVLIVCLVPALAPATALADSVTFRNECGSPVIVQSASVIRGVMRRDRPYALRPGDYSPKIGLDTDKVIVVYDGTNPNRLLFQGSLKASPTPIFYSIVPDSGKVRMVRKTPGGAMTPGTGP